MKEHTGSLNAAGLRIAIVVSRFNEEFTSRLLTGAVEGLARLGADPDAVDVFHVPGAFEIPQLARTAADTGRYDAIIALGVVIRGATSHYDLVAGEAARGVGAVARETGVPVAFGVVTTDTLEQALERCGTKMGNKGWDAAQTAVEMATLTRSLRGDSLGDGGSPLRRSAELARG